MGELRQQTGLISGFKVTLVQKNSGPGSRSQVSDLATLPGDTAQTCLSPLVLASATRHSEKENISTALREDLGGRGPPSLEATAAPSVPAEKGCAYRRSRPGRAGTCPSAAPRSRTTHARCLGRPTAGPRWACKPSPAAGCQSSCRPGAGAQAPQESPRKGAQGRREPRQETPASRGLPGFTAAAGRRGAALPPAWPAPGPRRWAPSSPRLPCLGAIVRARGAWPPGAGRAALSSLLPRRVRNSGRGPLPWLLPPPWSPRSRFPRRHRLLRPQPPCFPSLYLALPPPPVAPLSSSASNVRRQQAPVRAAGATTALKAPRAPRRQALLAIGSPFPPPLPPPLPSSSQSQSRRHLGSPLNSGARGHPGSSCRGGPLAPPFKETGARPGASLRRRPRIEAGERRGVAEVAGAQGAEEAERWSRRWRPGAPSRSLHAPSYERWAVCASVAPCVRHQPSSGTRKWRGARLRRACGPALCPRCAWCLGRWVGRVPARVAHLSSRRATSAWGSPAARPPPRVSPPGRRCCWAPRVRSSAGSGASLTLGGSPLGRDWKASGKGHRFWLRCQLQVLEAAMKTNWCSESRNLGHCAFSGPGTKPRKWQV